MPAPWFATVIFDCDSTLSALEGVDELSGPHRAASERLTRLAMQGELALEQVYAQRLDLIRPSQAAVKALGQLYVDRAVPDARDSITALLEMGIVVQILSGGFAPAVGTLGHHLGLAADRVAAVDLRFTGDGAYAGFDQDSPMARSGGKREWIDQHADRLPRRRLLVGDGITDLEARPAVDCFAAFTGVVRRDAVVSAADVVLTGPGLAAVVDLVRHGPSR